MDCPPEVLKLIERFEREIDSYRSGKYNETQVRREFIDPLFKALGWDIDNEQGYAEAYKDVVHEDAIKVGTATKAPDYCFRIGGTRKFFLEAKKPSINVKEDVAPAFQLRRYAWSAKLPLSVLTDFEEFAVYDCRAKPAKTDKASAGRILYLTYRDYQSRWDEIAGVFSRDAILKGSFDKFAESSKGKRGTTEVDAAFLAEIEGWRESLARNLALRNHDLSQRELNFAVQQTIDRVIFLRICEDRGIEDYGQLLEATKGSQVYPRLLEIFTRADQRYNSGLFHFEKERGRGELPDLLTPGLAIDDKSLRSIIARLYYPDSPYEFSVLPADILGQVYEQFLGKVIRLTAGHRAVVEDKPEVKKAGGVFYTPTYIVDYIVKETVGQLLEGSTPKKASDLRILDPACGSGSFLIGAFQYLVDWHRDWYVEDGPKKHTKQVFLGPGGEWRLTTAEKKRLLLNNIYGVDIDAQAVETTKLSLLLKVLEGETSESINAQLSFLHERALPDLASNIKCGNSLIGPDFYDEQQLGQLGNEERNRINAFDWQAEFQQVMGTGLPEKRRGFDAVIGNPPYGFHQIHPDWMKPYLKATYRASQGSFEHYFLFYEASLRLLAKGGLHGFIVPVTWLTIPSADALRRVVLDGYALRTIAWLPELVFSGAQVNTLVSIIENGRPGTTRVLISAVNDPSKGVGDARELDQQRFISSGYLIHIFEDSTETELLDKMESDSAPLGSFARPCSGYNPYEVGKGRAPEGGFHTAQTVAERPYHSTSKLGPEWKPELGGRDLGRYSLRWPGNRFIRYGDWLAAPRDPANFLGRRLLVQEITGGDDRRIVATYTDQEMYHSRDVIPVKVDDTPVDPLALLAVTNSRLISWWHNLRSPKAKKALFPKLLVSDLKRMPIAKSLVSPAPGDARVDRLVDLARRMLTLNAETTRTPSEQTATERQKKTTDHAIDRIVYDLYGLTDAQIDLVESSFKRA